MYEAEQFLDNIETAWEETQLIDGRPGEEATIARRKDNEWFVGSIVAGAGREIEVPFDFLDSNRPYIAEVTKDVEGKRELEFEHHGVRRGDTVSVSVPENGGFTIHLVPVPKIDPVISVEQSEETLMTILTNYARSSRTNIEFSLSLPDELVIESRSNTSARMCLPETRPRLRTVLSVGGRRRGCCYRLDGDRDCALACNHGPPLRRTAEWRSGRLSGDGDRSGTQCNARCRCGRWFRRCLGLGLRGTNNRHRLHHSRHVHGRRRGKRYRSSSRRRWNC